MPKASIIKRPTENAALGRVAHAEIKPMLWPNHPNRLSLIRQYQGESFVMIPSFFAIDDERLTRVVVDEGGWIGYIKCENLASHIKNLRCQIKEFVI